MNAMHMGQAFLPDAIPLHCHICPEKPDFSDVSHLLTHIASKGHLSTYYKIKVKASSEEAFRQLIRDYDTWYAQWHIEDLMSNRLSQKEKRNAKLRSASNSMPAPTTHYQMQPAYALFPGGSQHEHAVDPRLALHPMVKTEALPRGATSMNTSYADSTNTQGHQHSYTNAMPLWHPAPYMFVPAASEGQVETSSEASFVPGLGPNMVPFQQAQSQSIGESDEQGEENKGQSKIKGVVWPGMDMFDAAPLEQRRKRNQKKDTSVVKQLEAASKTIEAIENIYSADGTLCRSRPIPALPDDGDSPLPGEETPPRIKKAKGAPRKKALDRDEAQADRTAATRHQRRGRARRAAVTDSHQPSQDTVGGVGGVVDGGTDRGTDRRQMGAQTARTEATFDSPATMATLTSGFCPPAPPDQGSDTRLPLLANYGSNDAAYFAPQTFYPCQGFYANTFGLDQQALPSWDLYAHDSTGPGIVNPLYLGMQQGGNVGGSDDQQTVSIPSSEQ